MFSSALPGYDNLLPPTFRCWDVNGPRYILWSRMKNPISSLLVQCWHFANLINHPKLPILNKFWERGSLWEKEEGKNTKLERIMNQSSICGFYWIALCKAALSIFLQFQPVVCCQVLIQVSNKYQEFVFLWTLMEKQNLIQMNHMWAIEWNWAAV